MARARRRSDSSIPLKKVRQFEDAAKGNGVAFVHRPNLNDIVNEIQYPKQIDLDVTEDQMRIAYLSDARFYLMRRGIKEASSLKDFEPTRERSDAVRGGVEHGENMEKVKNATIEEDTRRRRMLEKKKVERSKNHPKPAEHHFDEYIDSTLGMSGELGGRVVGGAVGASVGTLVGGALNDEVSGAAMGITTGNYVGAKLGRHAGERLAKTIKKEKAAMGQRLLDRVRGGQRELEL